MNYALQPWTCCTYIILFLSKCKKNMKILINKKKKTICTPVYCLYILWFICVFTEHWTVYAFLWMHFLIYTQIITACQYLLIKLTC